MAKGSKKKVKAPGPQVEVEIGRLTKDLKVEIDPTKLDDLKRKLARKTWKKVKFVALNAPFKRRSPIAPA